MVDFLFPDIKISEFTKDQKWKRRPKRGKSKMEEHLAKVMRVVAQFETMPGVIEATDIQGYDGRGVNVLCRDEDVWDKMRETYGPVKTCFDMGRGNGPGICFVDGIEVFFNLPKPDKENKPSKADESEKKTEAYVIEVKDTYKDRSYPEWVYYMSMQVYPHATNWSPLEEARRSAKERQTRVMSIDLADPDAPKPTKSEYRITKVVTIKKLMEQN